MECEYVVVSHKSKTRDFNSGLPICNGKKKNEKKKREQKMKKKAEEEQPMQSR